jgi:hypothetical protein
VGEIMAGLERLAIHGDGDASPGGTETEYDGHERTSLMAKLTVHDRRILWSMKRFVAPDVF